MRVCVYVYVCITYIRLSHFKYVYMRVHAFVGARVQNKAEQWYFGCLKKPFKCYTYYFIPECRH